MLIYEYGFNLFLISPVRLLRLSAASDLIVVKFSWT